MSNQKILKKAIEKAVKNEWDFDNGRRILNLIDKGYKIEALGYFEIIFSHDFAKAIWGEEMRENPNCAWKEDGVCQECYMVVDLPAWQYHLQKMVLEKEPLKYLEKFL